MEPYLSQIMPVGFNFAPRGFALCDGQMLAISQNQSLFSLLGTMYGGDGRTSFALPDLRGRAPMGLSSSHPQGQIGGAETVTLSIGEIPSHNHTMHVDNELKTLPAANHVPANRFLYGTGTPDFSLNSAVIGLTGGSQGHENRPPYLAINWCIALQGIFPSRN